MYHPRVYEITLDRYLGFNENEVIFHQYDTESAKLSFTFLENGVPFDIPYTRLVLVIRKPDKKEVYQEIELFSGNTAEVILKNQALTVAGELNCQIKMYKDEVLESTWSFKIKVKPSIGNEDAIESTDEYQVLQQLFIDVDSKKDEMEQTITENINHNNNATQQMINAMKVATDEAIKSIDESAVGVLNQQVLDSNYQTFTTTGFMSRVGENKVATPSHLMETLELGDEDYEQLELLETPSTLEEPMEEFNPNEGIMLIPEIEAISNHEVVPIESGIARSAILRGQTLVNIAPIYYGAGNVKLSDEVIIKANVENAVANYRVKWFRPIHSLKPNTKYLIKFDITELNNIVGLSSYLKYDTGEYTYGIFQGLTSVGRYSIPFTTDSRNCTEIAIYIQKSDDETIYAKIKGVMVFEYVEGMETWDIPYFTGMQSVKMPVLTTTSKNLWNNYALERGSINHLNGGNLNQYTTQTRSKGYIPIVPNTKYIATSYGFDGTTSSDLIRYYDSEENFIGISPNEKSTFLRTVFQMDIDNISHIQLETGTVATTYESYKTNILSTPSDLVLGGIGDVKDTLDLVTGEMVERTNEVTMNISSITRQKCSSSIGTKYRWKLSEVPDGLIGISAKNITCMCDKFTGVSAHSTYVGIEGISKNNITNDVFLYIEKYSDGTDASKNALLNELKALTIKFRYLKNPTNKTVDLNNKPFFFKEGHILLSSEEGTLLSTLEYTVPTNLKGQADNNAESILSLEREKLDIKLVDMKATPNSVVKRDQDGNIRTANKLQMKQADQEIPIELIANSHLKVGNRNVWDDGNLIIETGKWTPHLSGLSANVSRQYGEYCRQGHLVYLYMEFESTQWLNHGHDVIFSGLPFASNQETPFSVEMIKGVVESTQDDYHRNIFGLVSGTTLKLYKRGLNGTWWETLKSYHGVHDHFIIRIAAIYRTQ